VTSCELKNTLGSENVGVHGGGGAGKGGDGGAASGGAGIPLHLRQKWPHRCP